MRTCAFQSARLAPVQCDVAASLPQPVGFAAFSGYLGEDKEQWKQYDATELLKAYSGRRVPVLLDTGTGDNFLKVCMICLIHLTRDLPAAFHALLSACAQYWLHTSRTGWLLLQIGQLLPEAFEAANSENQVELENRMQEGYDHSYDFIATFVEDHLRFHAKHLGVTPS